MSFFGDIGGFLGDALTKPLTFQAQLGMKALGLAGGNAPVIPPLLAPPLPPDATDEQIRQAVLMQRRKLLLGQGQGSTFLSGPLGDISSFMTAPNKAGGF